MTVYNKHLSYQTYIPLQDRHVTTFFSEGPRRRIPFSYFFRAWQEEVRAETSCRNPEAISQQKIWNITCIYIYVSMDINHNMEYQA